MHSICFWRTSSGGYPNNAGDFDTLIIILINFDLTSSGKRYLALILQIAPFTIAYGFYDIGTFQRGAQFANSLVSTIFPEHYPREITRQA